MPVLFFLLSSLVVVALSCSLLPQTERQRLPRLWLSVGASCVLPPGRGGSLHVAMLLGFRVLYLGFGHLVFVLSSENKLQEDFSGYLQKNVHEQP